MPVVEKEATKEILKTIAQDLAPVGGITVRFYRVAVVDFTTTTGKQRKSNTFGDIPEKAVKLGRGISHAVDFGDDRRIGQNLSYLITRNLDQEPIATFNFEYRSLKALKTLLVIPRIPELEERPIEELTLLEQREAAIATEATNQKRKLKEESRAFKIKLAGNETDDLSFSSYRPAKVPRRGSKGGSSGSPRTPTEIVDLT